MTSDLRLGLTLGYWGPQPPQDAIELAKTAERFGYDSVWTAEAYGSDVFTPLAWVGAHTSTIKLGTGITQISARTPVATAMTALTLDYLSGGRLLLGLGVSGPQVVEGWYGQPFTKPLARTREYVEVIRKVLKREQPVTNDGEHYPLPYPGGTGLGKPLKSIVHPLRADIPIYLAAEGQKNVQLATEIADGWMPIFYSPYKTEVYDEALAAAPKGFDIPCVVSVVLTDDVAAGLTMLKWAMALYIGGMGARGQNFYNSLFARYGYEDEAREIQDLFLDGKQRDAAAKVPDAFVDDVALIGPRERIAERLAAWRESGATSLLVSARDANTLRTVAEAAE